MVSLPGRKGHVQYHRFRVRSGLRRDHGLPGLHPSPVAALEVGAGIGRDSGSVIDVPDAVPAFLHAVASAGQADRGGQLLPGFGGAEGADVDAHDRSQHLSEAAAAGDRSVVLGRQHPGHPGYPDQATDRQVRRAYRGSVRPDAAESHHLPTGCLTAAVGSPMRRSLSLSSNERLFFLTKSRISLKIRI